jgi:hypothetical protein
LPQSVVRVEKQITGAPPPLTMVGYSVDVADENEMPPAEKKGIYSSCVSVTARETMNSFHLGYSSSCLLFTLLLY